MEQGNRLLEYATAALDYIIQGRVGLIMCGQVETARHLEPVIDNLRAIVREIGDFEIRRNGVPAWVKTLVPQFGSTPVRSKVAVRAQSVAASGCILIPAVLDLA